MPSIIINGAGHAGLKYIKGGYRYGLEINSYASAEI